MLDVSYRNLDHRAGTSITVSAPNWVIIEFGGTSRGVIIINDGPGNIEWSWDGSNPQIMTLNDVITMDNQKRLRIYVRKTGAVNPAIRTVAW